MPKRYLIGLLLLGVLAGCAHRTDDAALQQRRIDRLSTSLMALSPDASPARARQVAELAVTEAAGLREKYQVTLTPWIHNIEVNSGLKPRGHCYHYAQDIAAVLKPELAPDWQLHYLQAKPGELLEHNAISITATGQPWDNGIVLDGWRYAGVLYFGPVKADHYPWQPSTVRH